MRCFCLLVLKIQWNDDVIHMAVKGRREVGGNWQDGRENLRKVEDFVSGVDGLFPKI